MSKINFYTNKNREISLLKEGLSNEDLKPLDEGVILKKVKESETGKINESALKEYVEEVYGLYGDKITKTATEYQKSWNAINESFFKLLKEKTGFDSPYESYKCHVSIFFKGLSDWGGNEITRSWRENPFRMRKITAHELFIAYLWPHLEGNFPKEGEDKIWGMAELSAWTVLSYDQSFLEFWPWFIDYGGLRNYPHLNKHIEKSRSIYNNEKDFKNYLKSIKDLLA